MVENIRNISIGIGIMILLPLMTHVGTRLIIKDPPRSSYNSPVYKLEQKKFAKYYFYVTTVVGIAAIAAGIVSPLPFLGMGFILGGVFCITAGYFRYWDELNDLIKFISLLIALVLLVVSSFKFIRVDKK